MVNKKHMFVTFATMLLLFTSFAARSDMLPATGSYVSLSLFTRSTINDESGNRLGAQSERLTVPAGKKFLVRNISCSANVLGDPVKNHHVKANITIYGYYTRTQHSNDKYPSNSTVILSSGYGNIASVANTMSYQPSMFLTEKSVISMQTNIYNADEAIHSGSMRVDYYCTIQGNLYTM